MREIPRSKSGHWYAAPRVVAFADAAMASRLLKVASAEAETVCLLVKVACHSRIVAFACLKATKRAFFNFRTALTVLMYLLVHKSLEKCI